MKTKNRLLLTSAMMLALVAVSGTTATYAWWVSNLSVEATVNSVSAAADASLSVALAPVNNCTISNNVISASGSLTDVTSKDGNTFTKAIMDSEENITSLKEAPIATKYAEGVFYAIRYKATITMPSLAEGLTYNVYLGDDENVMLVDNTTEKAARLAVSNGTSSFVLGNEPTGNYQSSESATAAIGATYKNLNNTSVTETTAISTDGTFGVTDLCLGKLTSDANELTITFTMWFEGAITQDTVDTEGDDADKFEAHLYFYSVIVA